MTVKTPRLFATASLLAFCGFASAYTISGTVSDEQGKAIQGATASLVKEGKTATTDDQGKFSIHEEEEVGILPSYHSVAGYISVNNGFLSYQSGSSPVQVKIFNSIGSLVSKTTLRGSGMLNLSKDIRRVGPFLRMYPWAVPSRPSSLRQTVATAISRASRMRIFF